MEEDASENKEENIINNIADTDNKEALKEFFFSTDLEQYFKKGSLPIVFITHTLSAIFITYIVKKIIHSAFR